jgi:hypothetical protein
MSYPKQRDNDILVTTNKEPMTDAFQRAKAHWVNTSDETTSAKLMLATILCQLSIRKQWAKTNWVYTSNETKPIELTLAMRQSQLSLY